MSYRSSSDRLTAGQKALLGLAPIDWGQVPTKFIRLLDTDRDIIALERIGYLEIDRHYRTAKGQNQPKWRLSMKGA